MSHQPLLTSSRRNSTSSDTGSEMGVKDDGLELVDGRQVIHAGSVPVPDDDPTAPSQKVSSTRQRISDLWTILCAGCALISDGYSNSLMTMINVVLKLQYPTEYTSKISTRVSNALLIGEIIGQLTVG